MEDVSDGLGHAKEESRAPRAKASKAGGRAPKLKRLETMAADATTDASVAAEARLAQTEGAATTKVIVSHSATNEVVAGDIATTEASSGPAGLGDLREATGEVTTEVPASVRASEPPIVVVQAASTLELASTRQLMRPRLRQRLA
jgi:hypothetical protein